MKGLDGSNPPLSANESAMLSILRRTARNRRACGAWWFQSPPEISQLLRFRRRSPGFSPSLISAVDFGFLSTNLSSAGWAHNQSATRGCLHLGPAGAHNPLPYFLRGQHHRREGQHCKRRRTRWRSGVNSNSRPTLLSASKFIPAEGRPAS
jgi:hypothetical protein